MHKYPTWVMTMVAVTLAGGLASPAFAVPRATADDTIPTVVQESTPEQSVAGPVDKERLLRCQRESERIDRIMEWAEKNPVAPSEYLAKIYDPYIKGNQRDYPVNQQLADRYLNMAKTAQQNKQPQTTIEKYQAISKAYAAIAEENQKILNAMVHFDISVLHSSCSAIEKAEAKITELTGRPPRRSWFTWSEFTVPDSGTATRPMDATVSKRKSGSQATTNKR